MTDRNGWLSLSPAQTMILLSMKVVGDGVSHIPTMFRIRGDLDEAALARAISRIACRHEPLRTVFAEQDAQYMQRVCETSDTTSIEIRDETPSLSASDWIGSRSNVKVDLENGPPCRFSILRSAGNTRYLHGVFHHLAFDGASMQLFFSELEEFYREECGGQLAAVPKLSTTYSAYVADQLARFVGPMPERELKYWSRTMQSPPSMRTLQFREGHSQNEPRVNFASEHTPKPMRLSSLRTVEISEETTGDFERFSCAITGISSAFVAIASIFQILLAQYRSQTDVITETLFSGRYRKSLFPLIGNFVTGMRFLRCDFSKISTVRDAIGSMQRQVMSAMLHQELTTPHLIARVAELQAYGIENRYSRTLVDVRSESTCTLGDLEVEPLKTQQPSGWNSLSLTGVTDRAGQVKRILLSYDEDLFSNETIDETVRLLSALYSRFPESIDDSIELFFARAVSSARQPIGQ